MDRLKWIDCMKAFSIMAVVLNHTHIIPEVKAYVYLVCLPSFFFISGIFSNPQLSLKSFFLHKTKRLLLPYWIWGVLTWLLWLFIGRKYGSDIDATSSWWFPLKGLILGKSEMIIQNSPLWFLCCLMNVEWIYYAIHQIHKKWQRWLVILSISSIGCLLSYWRQNWIWEISAAFIILPLYAFGAEYGKQIREKTHSWSTTYLLLIFSISAIGVWIGAKYNAGIELHKSYIGNPLIYYPSILSVIGLWGAISLLLVRYCGSLRGLSYIGQNTLLVLCAHIPVFGMIKGIAMLCHVSLDFFETIPGCICLWLGTFVILLPASFIINKYCPWILGKQKATT